MLYARVEWLRDRVFPIPLLPELSSFYLPYIGLTDIFLELDFVRLVSKQRNKVNKMNNK